MLGSNSSYLYLYCRASCVDVEVVPDRIFVRSFVKIEQGAFTLLILKILHLFGREMVGNFYLYVSRDRS